VTWCEERAEACQDFIKNVNLHYDDGTTWFDLFHGFKRQLTGVPVIGDEGKKLFF
jgi:hypothetical protein